MPLQQLPGSKRNGPAGDHRIGHHMGRDRVGHGERNTRLDFGEATRAAVFLFAPIILLRCKSLLLAFRTSGYRTGCPHFRGEVDMVSTRVPSMGRTKTKRAPMGARMQS